MLTLYDAARCPRALVRLRVERFDRLSSPYYDALRGRSSDEPLRSVPAELELLAALA